MQFILQIMKCQDEDCFYCSTHPLKMPSRILQFLPDPTKGEDGNWMDFKDLNAQETTENLPSKALVPPGLNIDRENAKILVTGKLYHCVYRNVPGNSF